MAKNLEDLILKEDPDTIAGFVAEPVQGAGGVIPPSKGYFDLIQPILKKYKIPLIADEVICGFGRTGNLWGSQTYDIKPDIIISSKCLTAGYFPMGAVIVNKEFADEFTSVSEDDTHIVKKLKYTILCLCGHLSLLLDKKIEQFCYLILKYQILYC